MKYFTEIPVINSDVDKTNTQMISRVYMFYTVFTIARLHATLKVLNYLL